MLQISPQRLSHHFRPISMTVMGVTNVLCRLEADSAPTPSLRRGQVTYGHPPAKSALQHSL